MGHSFSTNFSKCTRCDFVSINHSSTIKYIPYYHKCLQEKPILHRKKNQNKNFSSKLKNLRKKCKIDGCHRIKVKVPIQNSNLKFKWIDQQVFQYPQEISNLSIDAMKKASFQEKLAWVRIHLENLKRQWNHGCELIQIDRQKIIQSSFDALIQINLIKELKVQFIGDGAEDAGGGLLRQWMHLCVKEIMSEESGIFKLACTDETAYQMIWKTPTQTSLKSLYLLGLIIGKAILQKTSLNCCLDHTIIRQMCCQPICLQDVYSYDKNFYQSWLSVLKMTNVEDLYLNGTVYHQLPGRSPEEVEVFPNGKNTQITQVNKQMYLSEIINLYCTKSIEYGLQELCKGLHSVIPAQLLSIFEPYQFDMLINGPNTIDIQDWKNNTVYDAYEKKDQAIEWFWEIVESYGQDGYRNLLHYVTGSARVHIMGFSKLETSHGHVKKFTIRKIQYDRANPYPKSYTCFNRLDLPQYPTKKEMKSRLAFIMEEEFTYFGLC